MIKKYPYFLTTASIIATVIMMVYTAQPWGDNYAYEDFSGYLGLLFFISWAIAPYLPLFIIFRKEINHRAASICRAISVSLICFPTLAIIVDTVFIHLDAQGGLVFLFLPVYQWIAVIIFIVINSYIEKKRLTTQSSEPNPPPNGVGSGR